MGLKMKMRCPVCGGDFPKLTGHVHDPEGLAWWDRELSKAQRDLDRSVTADQAREYVREERSRAAAAKIGQPYPPPRDGFINDYD